MSFRHSSRDRHDPRRTSAIKSVVVVLACGLLANVGKLDAQVSVQPTEGVVVNIADRGLSKKVTIGAAKLVRVGPVSRVQVTIINSGSSPVDIQYIAKWMDSDGFEIPSNSRWEPARIDSFTDTNISLLGNSKEASNVVVNVKPQ